MSISLTLPYPPSANRYWRVWRNRAVKSKEAIDYQEEVGWTCKQVTPIEGDVSVTLTVFRPAKRGDLDNTQKCLLDALKGIAYHDDKQIVRILATRHEDKKNPRVEVLVEPYEETHERTTQTP